MKTFFSRPANKQNIFSLSKKFKKAILFVFLVSVYFFSQTFSAQSQRVIPTKGKDFWIGFPYHPLWSSGTGTKRTEVFITSDVNTIGTIAIPQQGWFQAFSVTANQTTTIQLPSAQVDHVTSDVVENKGVQILTLDTVNVFALTFQSYSADASVIYPKQSLGTEYRVCSYRGLNASNPPNINSELLVVATEDGTQVLITPTTATLGGHAANVPFQVNLNAGESYQVLASTYSTDLTGSVIKATDSSGTCRPFAVFSGSTCVNVPSSCGACDIIYDQALPVANWGTTYYSVPFSFATTYTLRILADQNNTFYTIDGGPVLTLNAGQFQEINGITSSRCINSVKPISVIQYMEGIGCAGAGDPSMMYLNSQEQKIDNVTFSTVTSTVINQHNVNVIMETANISQLTLDGNPVPASAFTVMNYCNTISYAKLSVTQGSHTLNADSGFTAYSYGTGSAESYAYSVGSFSKSKSIVVDSLLCSSDTIHIGTSNLIYGVWWSSATNPTDTLAYGNVLTLTPPITPDIYIEHGTQYISGCDIAYYFDVAVPDPPTPWVASVPNLVCQNQQVPLSAGATPPSSVYQYSWTPVTGLSNPNIANPVATASVSMWYYVAISTPNGCAPTVFDSVYIDVQVLPLPSINAGPNQTICLGDTATITAVGGPNLLWSPGGNTTNVIAVNPVTNTNYIVYVTDANGCMNSDTMSVIVNTLPNVSAGMDVTICQGYGATLTAIGGVSYSWSPGGSTNSTISVFPTVTTNYIAHITSANGCSRNDTVVVFVNPSPVANAGISQTICPGNSATLTASGGVGYLWSNGANTNTTTVFPLSSTNYIVTVTNANGCFSKDTVLITVAPIPNANAGPNQSICVGATTSLNATGGSTYSWMPGSLSGSNVSVSPLATTNYIVFITDANGCQDSDTMTVAVNPLPAVSAGLNQSICQGTNATLTGAGGVSYLWSPIGSTSATITVSPAATTNYILHGTDINGCVNTDTVLVTVHPSPPANAGIDKVICPGSSTTLTATGGTSYLWAPGGNVTSSILVSPVITTSYIVTVTDGFGCIDKDTVIVTVVPLPNANAGINQAICIGASTTLTATGGVTYLWNPGNLSGNTISVSPNVNSDYIVLVTDTNGCQNRDTISVTVNSLPVVNAGANQTICRGDNATLSGTGGVSYLWNPGALNGSNVNVSPPLATSYIVLVTDANGCQNTDTVLVSVNQLPLTNAGANQIICPGNSATLTVSGGNTYFWSPGGSTSNTITVTPAITTNYIVTATDLNGCHKADTVQVIVHPLPNANAGANQAICIGASTTLTATGGVSYLWSPGGSTSNSIVVNPLVSTNYSVIVTDSIGCINDDSVFVTVHQLPIANAGSNDTICSGLSTTLSASLTGVSYLWTPGGSVSANNIVSPVANTNYVLEVTDNNGCKNYDTVYVHVYPLPVADAGIDQMICPGTGTTISASGGTTYLWTPGGATTSSIQISPSNALNYIVLVGDIHGCLDRDTVFVGLHPQPVADFNLIAPLCKNSSLSFVNTSSVSPGSIVSSTWNFGDGNSSSAPNPFHTYSDSGNYPVTLTVWSDQNCVTNIGYSIYVNPNPVVDFTSQDICAEQPVQFNDLSTVSPGTISQWLWDFGDGNFGLEQNPIHIYLNDGIYDVSLKATSDSGCATLKNKPQSIEIYALPDANFHYTPDLVSIMNPVVHFIDQSTGAVVWNWVFGDQKGFSDEQNPFYTYADTGTFNVEMYVTSINGCLDTAYGEVHIDSYFTLYIPNAFTPNGDGINDNFIPNGICIIDFDMLIFDRWGKEVFRTSNIQNSWNGYGQSDGKKCMEGVYVYVVNVKDFNGDKHTYKGQLNLIR